MMKLQDGMQQKLLHLQMKGKVGELLLVRRMFLIAGAEFWLDVDFSNDSGAPMTGTED